MARQVPSGDHGLGLCLSCFNNYATGQSEAWPRYAVVLIIVPTSAGVPVTVPACHECGKAQIEAASKPPLWTGNAGGHG